MKFHPGVMLQDIVGSFFKKPVTEKYPYEKQPAPEQLRGQMLWNGQNCTGCCLCVMDCPANAIELITIDKKNRQFVMKYHMDRCTYCAQCVVACKFGCIDMSNTQWELAALDKQPFTVFYGKDEDIQRVLESKAAKDAGLAEEPATATNEINKETT
jgi:formate hydrogenlyase subunit 6/NADH:ubiquinone oxidoreductase subunit I